MEEEKKKISSKKIVLSSAECENKRIDLSKLTLEELISRISLLSKNVKPYSVSKEIEEIKSNFYLKINSQKGNEKISTEFIGVTDNSSQSKLQETKFKLEFSKFKKIKEKFRKDKERKEEENLKIKKNIILEIDKLANEKESLKITFEKFKLLQKKWKNIGPVPLKSNNDIWQSYHHHVELFYDYIKLNKELRDLDFKRNLEEKTLIYQKAVNLLKEKSINKAHYSLQELHEHWKDIGPVERNIREVIWEQFQEISKEINKRRNDHFISLKEKNAQKINERDLICKQIDELSSEKRNSHNQWQDATKKCNELESKWKLIGKGSSKELNKKSWRRIRDSINIFYNTKKSFYKERKENINKNIKIKLAICIKGESIQKSTDWHTSAKKLIKLQEEWKKVEYLNSIESNEIWRRFKNACDIFFKAKKEYYKRIKNEQQKSIKKRGNILQELIKFKVSLENSKNIKELKGFSLKWKETGRISKEEIKIQDKFYNLLNEKFSEMGLDKKKLENEKYKNKISSFLGNRTAISHEYKILQKKILTLKKEITQYENNISFFGQGKSTEPLLNQAQKSIENTKSEIADLEHKKQLLSNT